MPASRGAAEQAQPGVDGITAWNASAVVPPCATGSVNGPMIPVNTAIEPGQPCVTSSGMAPPRREGLVHTARRPLALHMALVPEPHDPGLLIAKAALQQPVGRGLEQQQMVLLPLGIV